MFLTRPIGCRYIADMRTWSLQQDSHELIVLSLLAEGPMYGYGLTKAALARSEGKINLTPGVLYPLLKRLESEGLVDAEWEAVKADAADGSTEGRKRKWYRLLPKGRKHLQRRRDALHAFRSVIDAFLGEPSPARKGRS